MDKKNKINKRIIIKTIVFLSPIFFFFSAYRIFAAEPDMIFRNAKTLGMGNVKVAGGFTYNGFVYNPALLTRVGRLKFCAIRIPITINDHIYDFANFIKDEADNIIGYGELDQYEKKSLIDDFMKRETKWGRVFLSPMVDIAASFRGHHLGLALYSTNRIGIKMDRGIYEPRVFGIGVSTVAFIVGYAHSINKIRPGLNLGVNFKLINRRRTGGFQLRARDLGNIFETVKPIYDEYRKKAKTGVSFDVGTLYKFQSSDSFLGVTAQFLGMGDYFSLDIGYARRMFRKRLLLCADYIDLFDNNKENIFKKIHLGAEYRYLFLAFRAGFNSGYPTAGVGLNFKIIDLDFAYFSDEMSKTPGISGDERYMTQLKIGW